MDSYVELSFKDHSFLNRFIEKAIKHNMNDKGCFVFVNHNLCGVVESYSYESNAIKCKIKILDNYHARIFLDFSPDALYLKCPFYFNEDETSVEVLPVGFKIIIMLK